MTSLPAVPGPARVARNVELVQLPEATIRALAEGDLAAANRTSPIALASFFVAADDSAVWRMRSRQLEADPASAVWITRVVWDVDQQLAVGRAGYHGPPDDTGMVEVGYAIDPTHRRRGYARAALEVLLDRARREPGVRTVRAAISPDNVASRSLVLQYGFVEVGKQWDDEDGPETIYEVAADR